MRRPTRILTIAAAVPLTVLALTSCTQPAPLPTVSSTTATPTPTATPVAASSIATLAARSAGGGTVTSIESESDGTEWDVRVVADDGSVREVHLSSAGAVLAGPSADTTTADEQSANRAIVAATSVGLSAAQKRMVAVVPGGRVTAIELDDFQDRVVWQGDVLDGSGVRHDVRIDAVNGAVVMNAADAASTPTPTTGS